MIVTIHLFHLTCFALMIVRQFVFKFFTLSFFSMMWNRGLAWVKQKGFRLCYVVLSQILSTSVSLSLVKFSVGTRNFTPLTDTASTLFVKNINLLLSFGIIYIILAYCCIDCVANFWSRGSKLFVFYCFSFKVRCRRLLGFWRQFRFSTFYVNSRTSIIWHKVLMRLIHILGSLPWLT